VQRVRSATINSIIHEELSKYSQTAEITVRPIEVKLPAEQRPAEEAPVHSARRPRRLAAIAYTGALILLGKRSKPTNSRN